MKTDSKKSNFIVQGSILAIAGLLCRFIGMLYRIPLIDIIGTKGNGYYTSAYSIYNILLIISSYSLPVAISKVISGRLANHRYDDARTALKAAFCYATIVGAVMFALMFFGCEVLADILKKPFTSFALKSLAPTIWIMAYLGVLRGYFQGTGNMVPTAISQIIEQIINAVISIVMASALFKYGLKADLLYNESEFSYAYGAAGGTIGTGAGALSALIFFIVLFFLYGRLPKGNSFGRSSNTDTYDNDHDHVKRESFAEVSSVIILTLLPILLSSVVYNINTVIDDFIFSNIMTRFGMAASIVALWGVFGEYRILFNIPVAIANSLSSSVVPSLTNAVAERNRILVKKKIKLSFQFVMLIALPASTGLCVLAQPVCDLLFRGGDNTILILSMRIGSLAVLFYSISTISNGLLHGLGYLSEPLINSVIALIIHVISLVLLLFISKTIYSVIISNIILALVVCILNERCLHRHVRFEVDIKKTVVIPLISSLIMGAFALLSYILLRDMFPAGFVSSRAGLGILVAICIMIALVVYFICLVIFHAFTKEDLYEMPMGLRIYRLLYKLRLMD